MLECRCTRKNGQQRAFQTVLLLNPAHIVSVFAPYGSRNTACSVLTAAGVVYEVEDGYDAIKDRLTQAAKVRGEAT